MANIPLLGEVKFNDAYKSPCAVEMPVVTYASGRLGEEPVRSQGRIEKSRLHLAAIPAKPGKPHVDPSAAPRGGPLPGFVP